MAFKSLFSRKLHRYYLQPRIFQVNLQVRLYEKFILLDEKIIAHGINQAYRRACDKVKDEIEITAVGHRVIGKTTSLKKMKV